MGKLERIIKIGVPLVAAAAAVVGLELTGFPKHPQAYQFAKAELVAEYFGSFLGSLQEGVAYSTRVFMDGVAALTVGVGVANFTNRLN